MNSIKDCVDNGWPVYVAYRNTDKEVVGFWPFSETFARNCAESHNNREGPDTYHYASWDRYQSVYQKHLQHLRKLEDIRCRR